jgi:hypothetical protein
MTAVSNSVIVDVPCSVADVVCGGSRVPYRRDLLVRVTSHVRRSLPESRLARPAGRRHRDLDFGRLADHGGPGLLDRGDFLLVWRAEPSG